MNPFSLRSVCCAALSLSASSLPPSAFAQSSKPAADLPSKSASAASSTVATVDGQPVTEDELVPLTQGQLRSLRDQEYQIKRKALETLIGQKVLEVEAKKKNAASTDKLLEQEVDSKIPEPTDAELKGIYDLQKEQLGNRPFADVKAQLAQSLKKARVQQARQEYSARLREQANVTVLLAAPRTEVASDPARVRGNPKAKVMIVEFSDFQCPYCHAAEATLKRVMAKHPDQVALSYRDFPLRSIHAQAEIAAEASRCALEQGKFWEYHDLLFDDQSKLDQAGLLDKARTLKLDEKQFGSCLTGEKYKAQIDKDSQEGSRIGINGTPAFFVNGVFLNGNQPESAFESAIQDQLSATARP